MLKKKLLLLTMLLISGVVMADLTGKFLKVCQDGLCYLQKTADAAMKQFDKDAEKFISDVLKEAVKPMGIDVQKLISTAQKAKKDVDTLRADVEKLKTQIDDKDTSYNAAKNMAKAADELDDAMAALKKAGYTKKELGSAIAEATTGIKVSAIDWLWGGRSKEVKGHLDTMFAKYAIIRDNLPKLNAKELGTRVQTLIFEVVSIMDDITDMRLATGKISNSFISDALTKSFRGLRDDLAKVTTRIGTIVKYKSYVVGGPLSNSDLAKKVGIALISNLFDLNSVHADIKKINNSLNSIKSTGETLKQENPLIEGLAKDVEAAAKTQPVLNRISARITIETIVDAPRIALEEQQKAIKILRQAVRDLINLSLVMLEQVADIIERAHEIGRTIDSLMGGKFLQADLLDDLGELAKDLKSIRAHAATIHTELKKALDNF